SINPEEKLRSEELMGSGARSVEENWPRRPRRRDGISLADSKLRANDRWQMFGDCSAALCEHLHYRFRVVRQQADGATASVRQARVLIDAQQVVGGGEQILGRDGPVLDVSG